MKSTIENVKKVSSKIGESERSSQYLAHRIESDLEYRKTQIVEKAEWMIRDLSRLVEGLNEKGAEYNFNSLGEIQGKGSELDRLLGELSAVRKVYEELASW